MLNKFRDNLFYIGILIFSITLLVRNFFSSDGNIIYFFMGFSCSLLLVGVFVLIAKKKGR